LQLTYSSRDLSPGLTDRARFDALQEHIETTLYKADLGRSETPLHWHIDVTILGSTFVFDTENYSLERMTRTRKGIASDGQDKLTFLINDSAQTWHIQQDVQSIALVPGAAVALSACRPHDFVCKEPRAKSVGWVCQPATMPVVTGFNESTSGRVVMADSPFLALIKNYISGLTAPGDATTPALATVAERHLADLVALAIGGNQPANTEMHSGGLKAARIHAVLTLIDRHSDDPTFSAKSVGSALGISPRQVHRLLEETTKTFYEHVLERRLMRAHQLLADRELGDARIADIAARAGFTDVTHFNRLFRTRFGDTPTGARAAAMRHASLHAVRQSVRHATVDGQSRILAE